MGRLRLAHRAPPENLHAIASALYQDNEADVCRKADRSQCASKHPIQSESVEEKELPFIGSDEVRQYDGREGRRLFIVVDDIVLDCTTFISKHPGGRQLIEGFATQNCSWQWWSFHDRKIWNDVACTLRVGKTEGIENLHRKPPTFVGLKKLGYNEHYTW